MTLVILIELPLNIKKELSRIANGLPSADWNDPENFYIHLQTIGKLNDQDRWDMIDKLGEIQLPPFRLSLKGLNYFPKRNITGSLWINSIHSQEIDALKKQINSQLKFLNINSEKNHSPQAVRLATIQKELPERLALYLEANGPFISSPFEVNSFVLAEIHQSLKRSFYTVEKEYLLA